MAGVGKAANLGVPFIFLHVEQSTAQYIKKEEVKIRETVDVSFCGSAKKFSTSQLFAVLSSLRAVVVPNPCEYQGQLHFVVLQSKLQNKSTWAV